MIKYLEEIAEVGLVGDRTGNKDKLYQEFNENVLKFVSNESGNTNNATGFLVRETEDEPNLGFEVLALIFDNGNGLMWDQMMELENKGIPDHTSKVLLSDGNKVYICERLGEDN